MRRVDISRRINQSDAMVRTYETDLFILVQERADAAVEPVSGLVQKLYREGRFAFLSIVSLISALWYFVFRVLRLPDQNSIGSRLRPQTQTVGTAANEATIDITH
jgi:hypothetical protein